MKAGSEIRPYSPKMGNQMVTYPATGVFLGGQRPGSGCCIVTDANFRGLMTSTKVGIQMNSK